MNGGLLNLVVDEVVAVARPAATGLIPSDAELDAQLTDDPGNWWALVRHILDDYIDPLLFAGRTPSTSEEVMSGLPATAVRGAPESPATYWNTEASLRQVLRSQGDVAFSLPATNTLAEAQVKVLDLKLHTFGPLDSSGALDTYLEYVAAGRVLSPEITGTKNATRAKVKDLVVLEAFLVRYSAALIAAANVDVSLAEALALYRVEGDLLAPVSEAYLIERLPRFREKLSGGLLALGDDTLAVLETMDRGLWSYPFRDLAMRVLAMTPAALPEAGPERDQTAEQIKSFALLQWMLVIGGLDVLAMNTFYPTVVPYMVRDRIVIVGHEYRRAVGLPSTLADRRDEFDRAFGGLTIRWPDTVNGRVAVVPDAPILVASLAVTLALLVFGRDHAHGGGPYIQPPPGLEYLVYNAQVQRVPRDEDQFVFILASAAVAAVQSNNPEFATLRSRLEPLGLPERLPSIPKDAPVSGDHGAAFDKLTSGPMNFLDDPANGALLADFVLRAELADWRSWEEHRGNLARYRKLLSFYTALLS